MKRTVALLFSTCLSLSLTLYSRPVFDVERIESIQAQLTGRYGEQPVIKDYFATAWYTNELLTMQQKAARNDKSTTFLENLQMTERLLDELSTVSRRLATEFKDIEECAARNEEPEEPSYLVPLISLLGVTQQHLQRNAYYFNQPHTMPAQHPQGYTQPPPPPPSNASSYLPYPIQMPFQMPYQQQYEKMSNLEKFALIAGATVIAHGGIHWWFSGRVSSRISELESQIDNLSAAKTDAEVEVTTMKDSAAKILKDMDVEIEKRKSLTKQVNALNELIKKAGEHSKGFCETSEKEIKNTTKSLKKILKEMENVKKKMGKLK